MLYRRTGFTDIVIAAVPLVAAIALRLISRNRQRSSEQRHPAKPTSVPTATTNTAPAPLVPAPNAEPPPATPAGDFDSTGPKLVGKMEEFQLAVPNGWPAQSMWLPAGYRQEADRVVCGQPTGQAVTVVTDDSPEALRIAAWMRISETFKGKDGQARLMEYLPGLVGQAYPLFINDQRVPVGAMQLWMPDSRRLKPPTSINDIVHYWIEFIRDHARKYSLSHLYDPSAAPTPEQAVADRFAAMAYLCNLTPVPAAARLRSPPGVPEGTPVLQLPNLLLPEGYGQTMGIEAIAVGDGYSGTRTPYSEILYAQTIRFALACGNIRLLSTILDMRKGQAYSGIQRRLGNTFRRYAQGEILGGLVYGVEGEWAHLDGQTVPVDTEGYPLSPDEVPNYSEPFIAFLLDWLLGLATSDTKQAQHILNKLVGNSHKVYCTFDPRFEQTNYRGLILAA